VNSTPGGDKSRQPQTDSRAAVGYRPDATVHGLFRERAAAHPERHALVWNRGRMSYRDLDHASDRLAAALAAAGVTAECVVALALPRSPEAVIAALAGL
jgi:non-ribosomal peptide synthetase component F